MRAVDTNVVVRVLMRDDGAQTDVAEEFIARGAWISHAVLMQVEWVLREAYRQSDEQIALAFEMLLQHEQFIVQDDDVVAAALEQYRRRPSLGFADCLILETARKAGHLPLGTFDRALAKLDGAHRL